MTDALARLKAALADRYTIERELGAGGMATVYLARDLKHERQVAVKVLRPELAAALGPERFHQEIKIAANLHHPHILPLYDSGDAEGFLYYVMPYEEGQSLRDKLAHEGELPIAEAVRILRDVVDALSHAHKQGVVHRDIKPDNVMLSERHALVTDFGVAKAVSEATGAHKLTTEGVALGTPAYMSPEQAAADKHIDHRADIYALGALAYEVLTGRPPFTGTTPQEVLAAHVTKAVEPVTEHRATVPPALAQLVMKCLEKKAADRWQSAEELLPQLEALATPSGGVTPTGMMPVESRGWRWWAAVAAAMVAVATVFAVLVLRGRAVQLIENRVVVVPFENRSGDPELGHISTLVIDWVTRGLVEMEGLEVVPWSTVLAVSENLKAGSPSGATPLAIAQGTQAGIAVTGAYYAVGDSLQFQTDVQDVSSDRLLAKLDAITCGRSDPMSGLAELRQGVMGTLAVYADYSERRNVSERIVNAPRYEAYRELAVGWKLAATDWSRAKGHFHRAIEADPTHPWPLLNAAYAHLNLGELAEADSLATIIGGFRERLSERDRLSLDWVEANIDGDTQGAYRALKRAAELAPGDENTLRNVANYAGYANRPREAIGILEKIDPAGPQTAGLH